MLYNLFIRLLNSLIKDENLINKRRRGISFVFKNGFIKAYYKNYFKF